jgi:multisubunit Na+/H+ antiporter MnhG subunit
LPGFLALFLVFITRPTAEKAVGRVAYEKAFWQI